MKSSKLMALAAVAAAALAAGCGDDDDESAADRSGSTKAEFVQKAGAICERNKQRAGQAFEREFGSRPPAPDEGGRVLRLTLPFIRASGSEIARLEPPDGDRKAIAGYLAAYRRATAEMEAIAADPQRAKALMTGRLEDPFTKPDAMAGEYGIEKCSGDDA